MCQTATSETKLLRERRQHEVHAGVTVHIEPVLQRSTEPRKPCGQDKRQRSFGAFVRVSPAAAWVFCIPGASADRQGGALRVLGRCQAKAARKMMSPTRGLGDSIRAEKPESSGSGYPCACRVWFTRPP